MTVGVTGHWLDGAGIVVIVSRMQSATMQSDGGRGHEEGSAKTVSVKLQEVEVEVGEADTVTVGLQLNWHPVAHVNVLVTVGVMAHDDAVTVAVMMQAGSAQISVDSGHGCTETVEVTVTSHVCKITGPGPNWIVDVFGVDEVEDEPLARGFAATRHARAAGKRANVECILRHNWSSSSLYW